MRSRRVIVRLAPYVVTFGLLGSTLAWQNVTTQRVDEDLGTPRVVVDQLAVPTVRTDVPVEPARVFGRYPLGRGTGRGRSRGRTDPAPEPERSGASASSLN